MPEPVLTSAHIQIETGVNNTNAHRVLIDGRDVSWQVRAVEFVLEGGEPADVKVTYGYPYVTVDGEVAIRDGDSKGPFDVS